MTTPRLLLEALDPGEIAVVLNGEQAHVLAKVLTDYRSRVVPLNRAQLVAAGVREDLVDQVACVGGWEPEPWTELALEIFEQHAPTAPPPDDGYGFVHAADFEGTRLCGATKGLKTVFRDGVINCPTCLPLLAEVEDSTPSEPPC